MTQRTERADVVIIGAGHNGLVAANILAKANKRVIVLEHKDVVGGAVRTEAPFSKAPGLRTSTGAYLLGLMPPELIKLLDIKLPTKRRDPHYFLPTEDGRYLLFGSDAQETKRQFIEFFSQGDWDAHTALQLELEQLREDIAPTWLQAPLSLEQTAERFVRPHLQQIFIDLCRGTIADYLERFSFDSDLIKAMYAVTDAFSGSFATWDTPGSGMNFLVHNMCRLPGGDGTWMIVEGGMGTVTQTLASAAQAKGAQIITNAQVRELERDASGRVIAALTDDGRRFEANAILSNADPYRTQAIVGAEHLPDAFNQHLEHVKRPGSTLKVNLALKKLPTFTCLPQDRGQFGTTTHLLPSEDRVIASLTESFNAVKAGKLADFPTIEWYIHTTVDPSLKDEHGHHNSALFVQWVPFEIEGSSWEAEADNYVKHLLSICDRFAPDTSECVADYVALHPQKIQEHFGITHGHIHHIDNLFGFDQRAPYRWPIDGLYSCSAGCHPAGSVIGAAGHNAAMTLLADLDQG